MTKEAFRGVVWPREATVIDGQRVYRYAIVGVLVTETPLPVDANQEFVNGALVCGELGDALMRFAHKPADLPLGTASRVLTQLDNIPAMIEERDAAQAFDKAEKDRSVSRSSPARDRSRRSGRGSASRR